MKGAIPAQTPIGILYDVRSMSFEMPVMVSPCSYKIILKANKLNKLSVSTEKSVTDLIKI